MKSIVFFSISVIILCSCEKHECPDPVTQNDTTTYTAVLQPGAEGMDAPMYTYVLDNNYKDHTGIQLIGWTISGDPHIWRSYLDFDYSSIPSTAKIKSATLTLYADTTNVYGGIFDGHSTLSGGNEWVLKRVISPWSEATITWNTQPNSDNIHQVLAPASTSNSQTYVLDVTELVKDEFTDPSAYHGFSLQLQNETPYRSIIFCSSDHQYPQLRPKMEIEYNK